MGKDEVEVVAGEGSIEEVYPRRDWKKVSLKSDCSAVDETRPFWVVKVLDSWPV
jgi:hypothetical protein